MATEISWSSDQPMEYDQRCEDYYNFSDTYHDVSSGTGVTTILSSFFSIVGSLLIIITFVAYKEVRTVGRAILVFLAIADFFTGVGYIFGTAVFLHYRSKVDSYSETPNGSYIPLCEIQSFITTVFPISSFIWTTNLAVYFFITIVLRKIWAAKKLMIVFHITSWGIPLLICIPAAAAGILGPATSRSSVSWCWIKFNQELNNSTATSKLLKFYGLEVLCGKFWEIMAYFVSLVLCGIVKYTLYRRVRGSLGFYLYNCIINTLFHNIM